MKYHSAFYRVAALLALVVLCASVLGLQAATPRALAMPAPDSQAAPALAASSAPAAAGAWTSQGPAPEINGQQNLVNSLGQQQVSGDITAIAASPTDPNTIYIGAANGGVWKTTNATNPNPTWTPLTDNLTSSSSIGLAALTFDPTDPTGQTLVAGTAGSGGLNVAGANSGLYYTTNGGATWTTITGTSNNLSASGIIGVAARGNTLLAGSGNGLFRTTTGPLGTWTKISASGVLPSAAVFSIVADPANTSTLYVTFIGAAGGIFKTTDLGATWTNVTSGINVISSATTAFPAAVFNNGTTSVVTVWLNGTVNGAAGNAAFRSVNGAAFTALDLPAGGPKTMIADKTNPNLIYTGAYGSYQPGGLAQAYRLDASQPSGSQVTLLQAAPTSLAASMTATQTSVNVGSTSLPPAPFEFVVDNEQMRVTGVVVNATNSTITVVRGVNSTTAATHASGAKVYILPGQLHTDIYSIGVDANGALLAGEHGGLFRLPAPGSPAAGANYWVSANGNLSITEFVSTAYDEVSHVFVGGLQDNGSVSQNATGSQVWTKNLSSGDGGFINVDNKTLVNVPGTTLAAAVTSSATSLSVASAAGFPAVTKFMITVDSEKILVNSISGTTLTVSRGQLGTTAASHSSGATVTVPPQSIRYAGAGLAQYTRYIFDANNTQVSATGISLSVITDGGGYPPVLINAVDPKRLLFGGGGTLYETLDFGGTVTAVATVGVNNGTQAIAYGGTFNGVANPDLLYIGKSSTVYARTTAGGAVTALTLPPAGSGSVQSIVMNPADNTNVFITDNGGRVYVTTTGGTGPQTGAGAAWTNITGNLTSISGASQAFSIAYVPGSAPYIAVGTRNGVFASQISSLGTWVKLGTGLATAPVYTLIYDAQDNILATGTLGRGLWTLSNASAGFTALSASATNSSTASRTAKSDTAHDFFASYIVPRQPGSSNANQTNTVTAASTALTVNANSVTVNEGQTATNGGTFANANGNPVTLAASVGTLTMVPSPIHLFSGNGNTNDTGAPGGASGTINGGVTFTTGQVGQAFNFPGSVAASSTPNVSYPASDFAPGTGDFSVVFGIQTTSSGPSSGVLGNRTTSSGGNFFGVRLGSTGILGVELAQDSALTNYIPLGTSVAINDGLFHQIVVTRQGNTAKLYLDGSLNSSGTAAGPTNITGAAPFRLGAEQGVAATFTRAFNGLLDEVRIYNQALSPATITQDYSAFVAGNSAPYGAWSWSYATDDGPAQSQNVTITATDNVNNDVSSIPFSLVVQNVAPTATLSNNGPVSEGSTATVSFSGQSDPSTADTIAGFHYAYDFDNDGTFEVGGDGTYANASTDASATVPASFLAAGMRTVRGRIVDKDGGFTDYTTDITVSNAPPTASVTGPASALAGQQTTFVFHGTDTNPVDQAAGFTYNIDWGDGASETVAPVIGNGDAIARHAYAAAGNYTVQVTATDKNGATGATASAAISISAMTTPNLQAVIAATDIVYLAPASDAALHSEVSAINGLSAPASPVDITIVLGDGPYTGVTLSPPANIVLVLAGNHTADNPGTQITGASPAVTVTSGEVFVQGEGLTTATDSPTLLITGGHVTIAQDDIEESTGFNNVAVKLTGGALTIGFDLLVNVNGQGSFFQTYDPDAIGFPDGIDADLTPNTYAVDGTPISAIILSATDLESSANPSTLGQAVTFTAGIDVEADEFGAATGTVTFYDGAAVLGAGTISEVGPDVFEAAFTTSSLSLGTHTITAVYGGNAVYLASSATLTQQVGPFSFAGFFTPVSNPPTLNQVNAGGSVPLKFSLGGNRGLSIIAAGYPVSQQINCTSGAPIGSAQPTTAATPLSYDASTGRYTYTWKTQKSWANTCRQFTLRLTDGADHVALFKFK